MSSYPAEYENYYKSIVNRRNPGHTKSKNVRPVITKTKIYRRILQELIGTLLLFSFVITCKLVANNNTKYAYNYSKKIVNQNLDYKAIFNKCKTLNITTLQKDVQNCFDTIKSELDISPKVKNEIKSK